MASLTKETRSAVVKSLIDKMNEFYIFPDEATAFDAYATKKLEAGNYELLADVNHFANELTADLQLIVGDRHLRVNHEPEMYARLVEQQDNPDAPPSKEEMEKYAREARYANNDFKRVERLTGNIGYIQFNQFHYPFYAGDTVEAAMGFVAHCDALIFDLRQNRGGSPAMIQLITSYLFDHSTHINNFYNRSKDETTQFHTQVWVHGKKMPDVPVYVLTSGRTFSAAEEFTYNLKTLKRATIVGEVTGGGAHPVTPFALADGFVVMLCQARAVNPITNTNWEGIGVEPDIDAPQAEALAKAHIHALETLLAKSASDGEGAKRQWELDNVRALYTPLTIAPLEMERFNGRYGGYVVRYENACLTYTLRGFPGKLIAITPTRFVDLDSADNIHLEFVAAESNDLALKVIYRDDGNIMLFPRS
jgi:hypothetical protein